MGLKKLLFAGTDEPGQSGLSAGGKVLVPPVLATAGLVDGVAFRYMYDGYSGFNVPSDARMVAGYPWWTQAMWDRFQKNQYGDGVLVVQYASMNFGDVLDVEPGCQWPINSALESWISMRKEAGYYRPSIYCSLENVPAVRAATGKWDLGKDYSLWVAHWTGSAHDAYGGSSATQYASTALYDVSYVYDAAWPHRAPPPPPVTPEEPEIKAGALGPVVRKAQELLNNHGAKLVADGDFGPLTLSATREFQLRSKLVVDGIIGPKTWGVLEK